jgi:hypothetical protein
VARGAARDLTVQLRVIEAAGMLLASLAFGLMAHALGVKNPELGVMAASLMALLTTTFIAFARAALVPSTARWTLLLTSTAFVAVVPATFLPLRPGGPPEALGPLATAGIWWLLTTVLATITTSVIYGLRRDVAAARAFGQYRLVEKIGEGGMGVVYRARHHMLRRETALKVLPAERHAPGAIARFEREVQLTAQLTHANTVTIFDYGRTPDGLFYYTMELLDGATLEDVVAEAGAMPPARVVHILSQAAAALAEAHALGMVHRDVKPSNIMLCQRGGEHDVAKVLDFGLVRESLTSGTGSPITTSATEILGTPLYMSPEAITAPDQVSAASDIYALGAVAVLLLTGRPLFLATTLVEICSHHLHTAPPPLARSDGGTVPDDLASVVLACLAKKPEERPGSARDLVRALDALAPSFGSWGEDDAATFWAAHGEAIRTHARARVTASQGPVGATLTVDVDRRLAQDVSASSGDARAVPFPAI